MPTDAVLPPHDAILDPARVVAWLERESASLKADYYRSCQFADHDEHQYTMLRLNGKGLMLHAIASALAAGEFDLEAGGRRLTCIPGRNGIDIG
jgi:hypothetical protein